MKNKGTWIALGVFVLLLAGVLLTREKTVAVGVQRLEVPPFVQNDVTQVEIKSKQTTKLWKEEGGWKVSDGTGAGHPADASRVETLTQALTNTRTDDLVTDREERHSELEVDDAKAVKVKVNIAKKKPFEIWMGKSAQSGGVYVRHPGKKQVFILKSGLNYQVRSDTNSWRQHAVFPANAELLSAITVTQANATGAWDDTYTLEKKDNGWVLAEGTKVPAGYKLDAALAAEMAQQLKGLTAQDFTTASELAQSPTLTTITAKLSDGKNIVLQLGAEPSGDSATVPVRVEGQEEAYRVATPATSLIRRRASDLRDNTLLSFDPAKAKKLTLVANGKTTIVGKDGGSWKLLEPKSAPSGVEFDPQQVDAQLAELRGLKADRALVGQKPADAQTGLAKPSVSLTLSLDGAPDQKLVLGGEAKTEAHQPSYAKGSVDNELYLINASTKTRLSQGVALFKKPPPPPSAPSIPGLDQLPPDIRAKLEAQLRQQGGGLPNR